MKRQTLRWKSTLLTAAGLAFLGSLSASPGVSASDGGDAPATMADPPADLADLFVWHNDGGRVVVGLSFHALQGPGAEAQYDSDVLYSLHFDTNADNFPDLDIHCRFGENADGDWAIQVTNLPGAGGVFEGEVEVVHDAGTAQVFTGLRDDPFFFDLVGFTNSLTSGDLSFTGTDAFAGLNAQMIVLEFDLSEAFGAKDQFRAWATTGRVE